MPTRKKCKSLTDLTTTKVSEQIVNFCESEKDACSIITLAKGNINPKSTYFSTVYEKFKCIPSSLDQILLQKSLTFWDKKGRRVMFLTGQMYEKVCFFIIFFCLRRDSPWEFELMLNYPRITEFTSEHLKTYKYDLDFMLNFNHNLQALEVGRRIMPRTLTQIFTTMVNLKVLKFLHNIHTEALSILGKYCTNLQTLCFVSFAPRIPVPDSSFEQFCYSDYPENTTKNPICFTLRHLEGYFTEEVTMLLLSNFQKLQYFVTTGCAGARCYSTLVRFSQKYHQKKIFQCSLQNIAVDSDTYNNINDIFVDFPCLKSMDIYCVENLKRINSDKNNISDLTVSFKQAEFLLNFQDFVTPWPNLKKLVLRFTPARNSTTAVGISLSDMALNFPNLEEFDISGCKPKSVELLHPFRKLQKLILTIDGTGETQDEDFFILNHVPSSLKSLRIKKYNYRTQYESEIKDVLLTFQFPNLEELSISFEYLSGDSILELLDHYPNLKHFEFIRNLEVKRVVEAACTERNWDLKLS